MKRPFLTLDQAREIIKTYPTPFHIYDERGIRATARALNAAFAWDPGFKEYFAVKATPTPGILKILKEARRRSSGWPTSWGRSSTWTT